MKKLWLILALTGILVTSYAFSAMASCIYLGGYGDGKYYNDIQHRESNLATNYVVGGEYNIGKFKIAGEYLKGNAPHGDIGKKSIDFDSCELKGGYRVLDNDNWKLDLTLGYYRENIDNNTDTRVHGILVGTDVEYIFCDQFTLSGSENVSVNGRFNDDAISGKDAEILNAKIQGNFYFCEKCAAFLGYRYASARINWGGNHPYLTNYGLTFGVTHHF